MITRNPEFRRNFWLQWTPTRVVVLPLLLALVGIAACTLAGEPAERLSTLLTVFSVAMAVLALGWGGLLAAASVSDEVAGNTWDQQRLSSLSAWQMAWGKLLGATSIAWYGALIALAVALGAAALLGRWSSMTHLVAGVVAALAAQAAFMAVRLRGLDTRRGAATRSTTMSTALMLLGIWQLGQMVMVAWFLRVGEPTVLWWGLRLPAPLFALLLAFILLGIALLALWRTMGMQLMVRALPWAWPLGCVLLAVTFVGITASLGFVALQLLGATALVALLGTYFELLAQPDTRTRWQAIAWHARRGDTRRLLQTVPLWLVSLTLTLACLPLAALAWWLGTDAPPYAGDWLALLVMGALHAARDAGIVLFFAWGAGRRRNPALGMLLVTLVLGLLLPLLLRPAGLAVWAEPAWGMYAALAPFGTAARDAVGPWGGWLPWVAMALHIAAVGVLLRWRWGRTRVAADAV